MQPRPVKTVETLAWRGVTCRVTVTQNHRIEGWTLLEIAVVSPSGAPLPIAVDGHRIHGIEQEAIDAAGGICPFLTTWADRAATTPAYAHALARWKQGDLFKPT